VKPGNQEDKATASGEARSMPAHSANPSRAEKDGVPKEYRAGADDLIKPYVLLTNTHDGSQALRMSDPK
jgi:hypothetical protein